MELYYKAIYELSETSISHFASNFGISRKEAKFILDLAVKYNMLTKEELFYRRIF